MTWSATEAEGERGERESRRAQVGRAEEGRGLEEREAKFAESNRQGVYCL